MEEELCPLEDRRSAAELSLKLAVVHFTTITAYCHLLSMRGEPTKVICKKITVFFIFPGFIIVQHVMAILAIFSAFVWVRFKKLQDSTLLRSSLKRAPFILFGAIDQHDSQSRVHSSDEESKVKTIGRVIVVLALSAQCIGSCIIFARRYQHDATTIGDWRVLELAIAALLISLLTVVHLLWHPAQRASLKSHNNHLTYLDATLLYHWGLGVLTLVDSDPSKDPRRKWLRESIRIFFNVPTTFGAYWLQPWEVRKPIMQLMQLFFSGGLVGMTGIFDYKSAFCDECSSTGRLVFEIIASLNQIVFFTMTLISSAILLLVVSVNAFPGKWRVVRWWWVLLRMLVLILLGPLSWALDSILCFLFFVAISFPVWNLILFLSQIGHSVVQLIRLANWPTDLECPLLWSDPDANFLWHLM